MRLLLVLALSVALAGLSAAARADEPPKKGDAKKDDPDKTVQDRVAKQKVNLNFDATPIAEALETLAELTEVPVFLDPGLDHEAKVSLKVRDLTVKNAANLIASAAGGDSVEVWRGCLWLVKAGAKTKPPAPVLDDAAKKKLEQKLTFNFAETPIAEVAAFLADLTGVKFAAPGLDAKVSLRLKDAPLGAVLDVICRAAKLKLEKGADGNVFKKNG